MRLDGRATQRNWLLPSAAASSGHAQESASLLPVGGGGPFPLCPATTTMKYDSRRGRDEIYGSCMPLCHIGNLSFHVSPRSPPSSAHVAVSHALTRRVCVRSPRVFHLHTRRLTATNAPRDLQPLCPLISSAAAESPQTLSVHTFTRDSCAVQRIFVESRKTLGAGSNGFRDVVSVRFYSYCAVCSVWPVDDVLRIS